MCSFASAICVSLKYPLQGWWLTDYQPYVFQDVQYRVMLVVWQLVWGEIDFGYYTICWAAVVLAEWAGQVGRLEELENLSQHNQLPDRQHHPVQVLN